MRCRRYGRDYVGMMKSNTFNCPHCGGVLATGTPVPSRHKDE